MYYISLNKCYYIFFSTKLFSNVVQKGIHSSENLLNFKPKNLETEPMKTLEDLTNDWNIK